jgi:hypothetical protein
MNYKQRATAEACKDFEAGKISQEIFLWVCLATSSKTKTDRTKQMIESLYQRTGYRPINK